MADIILNCPECGKNLEIDGAGAGLKVNCPTCHADLWISLTNAAPSQKPET
jgi:endogenous inhibitor of DNA gyrase (YacG/DUF329 family)